LKTGALDVHLEHVFGYSATRSTGDGYDLGGSHGSS